MRYFCGLCNKPLTRSGEEHPCRSFSNAFWAQPTEVEMCSVPHCDEPVFRKGLCNPHYRRALKENPWKTEEEWETEEDAHRSFE
jgi:hypothetical protein